ncbi:hypothetical protein B0H19DRAFT_1062825 [Mycena capillaripes]|nr:hypothetical protein B0H19DRAFT_1062825 [Mycena capillaripes]
MITDLKSRAVDDVLSRLEEDEQDMKSMDPSDIMILMFNTETIEIGTISGWWVNPSNGHVGGNGGQGEGSILNIAPDVRWKSVSGQTGRGGTVTELGGNGGTGKAPVLTIARRYPLYSSDIRGNRHWIQHVELRGGETPPRDRGVVAKVPRPIAEWPAPTQESQDAARNGIVELASRLEWLATIASDSTKEQDKAMQALQMRLKSITDDFHRARSQGTIVQFFSCTDNSSSLAEHHAVLTQMIADLTVRHRAIIQYAFLTDWRSLSPLKTSSALCTMLKRWGGGAGGSGEIGGLGGVGEGPILNIAPDVRWKSLSGGTGGDGGTGTELGGDDGTGKAPVLTIARMIPLDSTTPADSATFHQSDEIEITTLNADGVVTVAKSTGIVQTESGLEYTVLATDVTVSAPGLSYKLQLSSLHAALVKVWPSHLMLPRAAIGGRAYSDWWLRIGVGVIAVGWLAYLFSASEEKK